MRGRQYLVVIAVTSLQPWPFNAKSIGYNRKFLPGGTENGGLFVRYSRDFVITKVYSNILSHNRNYLSSGTENGGRFCLLSPLQS